MEDPKILTETRERMLKTPYGIPSSPLMEGAIRGIRIALLSRHGKKHTIMPSNVPNQANIYALKQVGCTHILATTACGSLREKIKPGDFIFIDQFIDRTTKRKQTLYEKDHVSHIPMSEPFCPQIRKQLFDHAKTLHIPFHEKGTMVTIEGPRFSTRAESKLFRQWGGDVINMSTVPEVVLAREAGLHYASIAMSTDYDCWKADGSGVDIKMVLNTFAQNIDIVKKLIVSIVTELREYDDCKCSTDTKSAMIS